jgi:hypothetical protein
MLRAAAAGDDLIDCQLLRALAARCLHHAVL